MTRLVLGSASAGRLSVLRKAGVEPLVLVSGVDEDAILAALPDRPPAEVVAALARAKADDVVARLGADVASDCVVVGCDSMLLLDGRLCGKPGTAERAAAQWKTMAGRSGELITGHSLRRVRDGAVIGSEDENASTTVHFTEPEPADLAAYLATGEPLGVAGGFTLDGFGGWFVDRIDGDPSNVIGLSLPLMRELLRRIGISPSALWGPGPGG